MPILDFFQPDRFTRLITWEVTEEDHILLDLVKLTPRRLEKYKSLRPKQAKEYLGLRACLLTLNLDVDVFYDEKGKPFLESIFHVSITHSYGKVSVGVSHFPIGIDIELERTRKIVNIRRKFIREDEELWLQGKNHQTDYLHIIWGIKEGLYKINGGNLWNFLHHYKIEEFGLNENQQIICWISDNHHSRKYFAYYKRIEDHFLIWVLDYV